MAAALEKPEPGVPASLIVLNALPHPVLMVDPDGQVVFVNTAAESFLRASEATLKGKTLDSLVPFGSPLNGLVEQVRRSGAPFNEYRVDVSSPRIGKDKTVDLYVAPVIEQPGSVVVLLQERGMAEKIDRQLTHRGAARTVTGLASMLAHEIKNPLSGIRGAAQLLESTIAPEDRGLTRLITEETDRIVRLVDRMEVFSDERPLERAPVNIHSVFEQVKGVVKNGFGSRIRLRETYDPSLPPVFAHRDQLVQVFLNLAKNACEALYRADDPVLTFSTAYRPGIHLSAPGSQGRVSLPLEFIVEDNGAGVPPDIQAHMFDPFVTTKTNGSGLGLALVAKIVGDHGGVIECESEPGRTSFRILMPEYRESAGNEGEI